MDCQWLIVIFQPWILTRGVVRVLPSFGDVKASCFYWKSLASGSRVPPRPTLLHGGEGRVGAMGWCQSRVALLLLAQHTLGSGCLSAGRVGARGWGWRDGLSHTLLPCVISSPVWENPSRAETGKRLNPFWVPSSQREVWTTTKAGTRAAGQKGWSWAQAS